MSRSSVSVRKKKILAVRTSDKGSVTSVNKVREQLLSSQKNPKPNPNPVFEFILLWLSKIGLQYISLGGCSSAANAVLIHGFDIPWSYPPILLYMNELNFLMFFFIPLVFVVSSLNNFLFSECSFLKSRCQNRTCPYSNYLTNII